MEDQIRAYAAFQVKAMDDGRRTFKGWATTPAVDRVGDTINPLGVRFKNPVALLHQHRHDSPIGTAKFGVPTKKGIEFEAEIPSIDEPAALKERLDVAWGEIKHGLVRAVSVGFRPIKYAYRDDGGIEFQEIEVFELSAVTIPALPEAVITAIKSMSPLTKAVVREIKRFDTQWKERGIPLVYPAAPGLQKRLEGNAVKLIASP
jgi:HK97 family phage prohead protease